MMGRAQWQHIAKAAPAAPAAQYNPIKEDEEGAAAAAAAASSLYWQEQAACAAAAIIHALLGSISFFFFFFHTIFRPYEPLDFIIYIRMGTIFLSRPRTPFSFGFLLEAPGWQ